MAKSTSLKKMVSKEAKMDKKSNDKKQSASEKRLEKAITKKGGKK